MLRTWIEPLSGHAAQSPALVQSLLNNSLPADCGAGGASAGLVKKLRSQFAPLRRCLKSDTLRSSDVVAATVFTTGAFTHELQTIYEQIQGADAPALTGGWQTFEASTEDSAERDSSATTEETTARVRPSDMLDRARASRTGSASQAGLPGLRTTAVMAS